MCLDADVIVIGAGGGGAVIAKELGEKGLSVLLLEAGPWYGNNKWPEPNKNPGALSSSSAADLDKKILDDCFTDYEEDMNDLVSGKFRWGPADRNQKPWFRGIQQKGFIWQNSGVGGTTLQYLANSPRAYPSAVDQVWPISYREMIPYYEKVEATLPVKPAPMTAKEELFFYGAKKAGWSLLTTQNVTTPGYRPQPNAILQPDPEINNPAFDFNEPHLGCTLRGHCINGCKTGPSIETVAKRSTLVSYIPLALKTGNVEIRPNTFVSKILTENDPAGGVRASGVKIRNTWTAETADIRAKVIVSAAGVIETPRLWLNSKLPENPWVGKGLTNHWFDCITGVFDERVLNNLLGISEGLPYIGQTSGARFDYPGLGMLLAFGTSPGAYSTLLYGSSQSGYALFNPAAPSVFEGVLTGTALKEVMSEYSRTLSIAVIIGDEANHRNGISLDPVRLDVNGHVPILTYKPSKKDYPKREYLTRIAAEILKKAGAKQIIRTNMPPGVFIHMHSTMRIGYVTDTNCEAHQVKRLFIADNSVLFNSLGGPNPTLTTQALATRTAEKIENKYFSS
ncbi:GMC family oxidoreductase N-terminal domain-containing protein [Bacillus sp. USDA818B3_A]|uniref:GMC family oxidoreductase N-terminal domain-containing protein n=1 Tax=Bacillus sp. USDA818B3_A TaxID=2698834 RepID=UPI001368FD16|nr:GMC family oxidoreductase N-terminal domain-containing protein [Bacillus sp. USDA818B3_A]